MERTVIWDCLYAAGRERCSLGKNALGWALAGEVTLEHEGTVVPLSYLVTCNAQWGTIHATARSEVAGGQVDLRLEVDSDRRWFANGTEVAAVLGAFDVDLEFSPSTNMLPIRRLGLAVGDSAPVKAAWVRFPDLTVEPIEQTYTRLGEHTYRYQSDSFVADLEVDEHGLVIDYPGLWRRASPPR
jgi:hypothetical protein